MIRVNTTFLRWTSKSTIMILLIISLSMLNILTLINSGIHDFLYKGLSSLPVAQFLTQSPSNKQSQLLRDKNKLSADLKQSRKNTARYKTNLSSMKQKIKKISANIAARSVKNTTRNMASIPAESIPWIGTGVIIAVTAIDIKDSCDTMKDMNEIMKTLELNEYNDETDTICGKKVNFKNEYSEMKDNIAIYLHHLKETSDKKIESIKNSIDDSSAMAKDRMMRNVEKVKQGMDNIYKQLNGIRQEE